MTFRQLLTDIGTDYFIDPGRIYFVTVSNHKPETSMQIEQTSKINTNTKHSINIHILIMDQI